MRGYETIRYADRLLGGGCVVKEEKGPNPGVKEIVPGSGVVTINEEPVPLENTYVPSETVTILDEEIPLADVPGLGDESAIWMLVAAFAVFSLVVINAPAKKRED